MIPIYFNYEAIKQTTNNYCCVNKVVYPDYNNVIMYWFIYITIRSLTKKTDQDKYYKTIASVHLCLSVKQELRILIRAELSISPGVPAGARIPGLTKANISLPTLIIKRLRGEMLFEYFLHKAPARSPAWMFN